MKTGLLAELYRKVGEGLAVLDPHISVPVVDGQKIKSFLDFSESLQKDLMAQGVTADDLRRLADEGRP